MLLWLLLYATGARVDFTRERMLQFVGPQELASSGWSDLLLLHSQPPGFNALLKITDQFGNQSNSVLLAIFAAMTVLGLWMTADLVLQLTGSVWWASGAGILAALVPGTTFYSFWVFYTTPTAFLLMATVWGIVRSARTGSIWTLTVSVVALVLAALTRSSLIWVLVAAWLLLNLKTIAASLRAARPWASGVAVAVMLGSLVLLAGIQINAAVTYGSGTLSSWGFENASKALLTTMNADDVQGIVAKDECLAAVLEVGVFRPISEYPECSRANSPNGLPASMLLDAELWQNGAANMNHVDRLSLSTYWRDFAISAAAEDPTRIARIPFPSLANQERGTIIRFLWPSSWYWLIDQNVGRGGTLTSAWVVAFAWVPLAMLALMVVGLLRARVLWANDGQGRRLFGISSSAVLTLTLLYLFLETGENERFRVEIDWLLIALGVSVVARWTAVRRTRGLPEQTNGSSETAAAPAPLTE